MDKKIIKRDYYNAIITLVADFAGDINGITADDLKAFAEKEIAALDRKAAKAKETAAKKKTENDPIMDAVVDVLTSADDFLTIAQVTAAIGQDDVTTAKVTYRLSALVNAEKAESTDLKVGADGKKRTVKGYKLIVA